MSSNGSRMVQFGVFEVDQRAGELRRNGARVKLQEQPFQILALLLERPGEVVTREELQSRLWPADTFVDFDHSLTPPSAGSGTPWATAQRIPVLLRLSPAADIGFWRRYTDRSLRSMPKSRFRRPHPLADGGSPPRREHWCSPATRGWDCLWAGGGRGHSPTSPPVAERRLTANPSEYPISNAALSHDGRYLAFSDPTGFYLRQVETGETHPLVLPQGFKAQPGPGSPMEPTFWLPRLRGRRNDPPCGNSPLLAEVRASSTIKAGKRRFRPTASQIVFLRGSANSEELWLMGADGGQPRKLAGEIGDLFRSPVWSRDGKRIAYLRAGYAPGTCGRATAN